jgi:glycine/D-amino acid oxidase-like deaminating enzyme/nitrite reductase/ring-hydroxylating ferredoxin subunit
MGLSQENLTSGTNLSFWVDSIQPILYNELDKDAETDVIIVGGGITGITIAYCLILSGKKVILIEDGYIGSGETGRTTAHLVTALDDRYYKLEKLFGKEKTKLIAQSHAMAIDFIENTVKKEKIECDFERLSGYLFLHPSDKPNSIEKEYEAILKTDLSVEKISYVPGIPQIDFALKFNKQAQFHPLKYLKSLSEIIINRGGKIYTNTKAKEINGNGVVIMGGYKIKADNIVVATNSPVNNKYSMHLVQHAYRTYVIGAKIKKGLLSHALWWDTGDFTVNPSTPPYHYARLQKYDNNYDLLIVGGEDHPTGAAGGSEEERYTSLETWARYFFPAMEEVIYKWSGQILEPEDSLAHIGRNPFDDKNVFIATGDSGNGLTHGTIAGMLISDLINERENKWEKVYDPSRKLISTGKAFVKEAVEGALHYIKRDSEDNVDINPENIPINEGRIIKRKEKKYGAYHGEDEYIHFVSADCTHLGCTIKWNNDEKSWDCPCHGSRFSYKGKVLNGPANKPLAYFKEVVLEKIDQPAL